MYVVPRPPPNIEWRKAKEIRIQLSVMPSTLKHEKMLDYASLSRHLLSPSHPYQMFSSGLSTSSSAVVVQSRHNNSSTTAAIDAETNGTDSNSLSNKTPKAKKCDMKWFCPKCQGDVRLPPPQRPTSAGSVLADDDRTSITLNKNVVNIIHEEGPSVNNLHVMCSLKCSAPRYHVSRNLFLILSE